MNALPAFHNRTDQPSRFISSSVYYHEVFFETYAPTVDVDDPLPPKKEPTEAEGEQYLSHEAFCTCKIPFDSGPPPELLPKLLNKRG